MFKVGQIVRVMNLNELGQTFKKDSNGKFLTEFGFTTGMVSELCGKVFTITGISDIGVIEGHGSRFSLAADILVPVLNIGDEVVVKSWDEMIKMFDTDSDGDIKVPNILHYTYFTTRMRQYCGKKYKIERIVDSSEGTYKLQGVSNYQFSEHMLKKVHEEEVKETTDLKVSDLKVGMLVQFKSKDEIEKFHRTHCRRVRFGWNEDMTRDLCNKVFTIEKIDGEYIYGHGSTWSVSADMLKLVKKDVATLEKELALKEKEIADLKSKIEDALKAKEISSSKLFANKNDCTRYYYIEEDGDIDDYCYDGDSTDEKMFDIANAFDSYEAAEFAQGQEQLLRELRRFAEEKNGKVLTCEDFKDGSQKFTINVRTSGGKRVIDTDWFTSYNYVGAIYFLNEEDAKVAVEIFEERILKYFV